MRKLYFYIISLLLSTVSILSAYAQVQPDEVTSRFFSEPDIEIPTPAFAKSEGFTVYSDLRAFLENEIKGSESRVRLDFLGESVSGREIPVLYFGYENADKKIRIWYQGGLHGNEPAGSEGLLYLIHRLLSDPAADSLFGKICLAVVPVANIDGYEVQKRYNTNGIDLNRDMTKLSQVESCLLKAAFSKFSPHLAIDFHEYRPYRPELKKFPHTNLTIPYDILFLPSGNLNIPESLRNFTYDTYVAEGMEFMEHQGLSNSFYYVPAIEKDLPLLRIGGSSPRSTSTTFALTNCVSILVEIRGINLGRTSFKRRVNTASQLAMHYLGFSYIHEEELRSEVDRAIQSTLEGKSNIVLSSSPLMEVRKACFIDTRDNQYCSLDIEVSDANTSVPVKERSRPSAYLISAKESILIEKLQKSGISVERLARPQKLSVECYMVTKCDTIGLTDIQASQEVTCNLVFRKQVFPAGTYLVPMQQKNANLAVVLLEPEANNSFVNYGVLAAVTGKTLPIFRYSGKRKLQTK